MVAHSRLSHFHEAPEPSLLISLLCLSRRLYPPRRCLAKLLLGSRGTRRANRSKEQSCLHAKNRRRKLRRSATTRRFHVESFVFILLIQDSFWGGLAKIYSSPQRVYSLPFSSLFESITHTTVSFNHILAYTHTHNESMHQLWLCFRYLYSQHELKYFLYSELIPL